MWEIISLFVLLLHAEAINIEKPVLPSEIFPLLGQEVMLRLDDNLLNQTVCVVTTNNGMIHAFNASDMNKPKNSSHIKISYWGGWPNGNTCGVRIRNITVEDYGVWVLSSQDGEAIKYEGSSRITKPVSQGFMEEIIDKVVLYEEYAIDFERALISKNIIPKYCKLRKPDGQLFYEGLSASCKATLPTVTKGDLGTWTATVGIVGSTDEHSYRYTLKETEQSFIFGTSPSNTTNKNATNLFCNMQDEKLSLKICRFIRPGDKAGLNMNDHIGDGNYSYFGHGLDTRECGITLENPGKLDFGKWRCELYFSHKNGSTVTVRSDIMVNMTTIETFKALPSEPLYVLLNSSGKVSCFANTNIKQCSVTPPNGRGLVGLKQGYAIGECSVHIDQFERKHSGDWLCVMTPQQHGRPDLQTFIHVSVTESPLTAIDNELQVELGKPISLMCKLVISSPSITLCRFIRPDGTGYNLNSAYVSNNMTYKYEGHGLAYGECGLRIENVHPADHGMWTCSVRSQLEGEIMTDTINIIVSRTTNMFPSSTIVDQRTDVIFSMKEVYADQVKCTVEMPGGEIVDLKENVSKAVSYWGAGIPHGECGVRIHISSLNTIFSYKLNYYHMLKLTSVRSSGKEMSAIGWFKVTDDKRLTGHAQTTVKVDLGKAYDVVCDKIDSDYCILVPPGKDERYYIPGDCRTSLKPVRTEHLGNWTCIKGFNTSMYEMKEIITLITKGTGLSVGIDSSSSHGTTKLYCKATQSLNFCRFVSPNNIVFVLNDGMMTEHYNYWGNGLSKGFCGIAITNSSDKDCGLWKCFVGTKLGDIQGGYVVFSNKEVKPWVSPNNIVYTTYGSTISLVCKAAASLLYCWYWHPNGSQLAEVDRSGLELGLCNLTLSHPQTTDSGDWICHMGVQGTIGEELVSSIHVVVKDTTLFSNITEVQATSKTNLTLMCWAIPAGAHLQYCRWVRPDGKSVRPFPMTGKAVERRYWYVGAGLDQGECGLFIVGVTDVDYGTWTCAAWLQGQDREEQARIMVSRVSDMTLPLGLILGLSIGIVIALIAALYVMSIIRKRKLLMNERQDVIRMSNLGGRRQSTTSSLSNDSSGSPVRSVLEHRM